MERRVLGLRRPQMYVMTFIIEPLKKYELTPKMYENACTQEKRELCVRYALKNWYQQEKLGKEKVC